MAEGAEGLIPRSLQLPVHAPQAIRAYRRRFVSPCNNIQVAQPDQFIQIYPDTATPGAFVDPDSTYLMADLEILNNNYCVDYANFGPEGAWGGIIQEWRLFNQGQPTEEILEYGTVSAAHNRLKGAYDIEYNMFISQRLRHGAESDLHRNFIKPAMCDRSGNIMWGPNPFGLGYDSTACLLDQVTSLSSGGQTSGTAAWWAQNSALSVYPAAMTQTSRYAIYNSINSNPTNNQQIGAGANQNFTTFTGAAPYLNYIKETDYPSWSSALTPNAPTIQINQLDWPDYFVPYEISEPVDDYVKQYGSVNKVQIMANLCNVKCFPIGMIPATDCYNTGGLYAAGTAYGGNPGIAPFPTSTYAPGANGKQSSVYPIKASIKYRICARPLSGILGELASKMCATTLLAPQQFYIQIKTASPSILMQLASDPCRRLAGTIRDCIRNIGLRNGALWGDQTWSIASNTPADLMTDAEFRTPYNYTASAFAPGYSMLYQIPPTVASAGNFCSYLNSIFSPAAAKGEYMISSVDNATGTAIGGGATDLNLTQGFTTFATTMCMPPAPQYALVPNPWVYKSLGINQSLGYPSNWSNAAGGNMPSNIANISSAGVVTYANETQVFYGTRLKWSVPQSTRIFALTYDGQSRGTNPIPPATNIGTTYQLSNIAFVGDQIILPDEATEDIIAQAARGQFNVHTNSYRSYLLQVSNASTQTIIMPLKVNVCKRLLIVFQNNQQRSSNTAFYYDSNCGLNPFALVDAGGANTLATTVNGMTGLGTPTTTLTGVGYSQPLNVLAAGTTISDAVKLSGSATGPTISVQLRIGNDFYPPMPLQTMQELSVELAKTMEGFQNAGYSPNFMDDVGAAYTGGNSPLYYDPTKRNSFGTAFIPIDCCDDQTITCNYDMVPLYSYNSTAGSTSSNNNSTNTGGIFVSGTNGTPTFPTGFNKAQNGFNYMCPRGYCVKNCYVPPSSSFIMGFNMKSFKSSDGVTSGEWLGNQNITLQIAGACGLTGNLQSYRAIAILPHEAVLRYSPGGQILWAY